MAQNETITYISDISGKEIKDNDWPTVLFSCDGTDYEIDLTDAEQEKFRAAMKPYIEAGRKSDSKKNGKQKKAAPSGPSAQDIRTWAAENGHEVPVRGRVPKEIREAYDAAH